MRWLMGVIHIDFIYRWYKMVADDIPSKELFGKRVKQRPSR